MNLVRSTPRSLLRCGKQRLLRFGGSVFAVAWFAWLAWHPDVVWAQDTALPAPPQQVGSPTDDLDAALFYQLLLAEMQLLHSDPGAAYSLMLDAARRTQRPELYRRTVEIALQGQAGNAALAAAQDWARALPQSDEPLRYELQILLALNRPTEVGRPLTQLIQLSPPAQRSEVISAIPQAMARASDRPAALKAVRAALRSALRDPNTAGAAWAAIGRMELDLQNRSAALSAARSGLHAQPQSPFAAALAVDLFEQGATEAEPLIQGFLAQATGATATTAAMTLRHTVHLGYIRILLDMRQWRNAQTELDRLLAIAPEQAQAWLLQGILQAQQRRPDAAQASLERFLQLADTLPPEQRQPNLTQAYLQLAQLAERRRDFDAAAAWLDRIENAEHILSAQIRRAHLLARQGLIAEARALIQRQPERHANDAQRKLLAEAQMLRQARAYPQAFEVFSLLVERYPDDPDLIYDLALAAEKVGKFEQMETLLRRLMKEQPDFYHAFNALGYSLADRNERLQEARALILIALAAAPTDAYILDSLGWVEFRLGNLPQALRILRDAFQRMPDAEIAAHLGEVYWVMEQRETAIGIWREGLLLEPENATLLETLQRFQVQP